jgi:hypothetical protein
MLAAAACTSAAPSLHDVSMGGWQRSELQERTQAELRECSAMEWRRVALVSLPAMWRQARCLCRINARLMPGWQEGTYRAA